MVSNKTIDVIIPVYNGENYVSAAINSVINQTLKPNKIIIINDGSTDKTSDIIREISKNSPVEIKLIEQKNSGLSRARNAGIKNSEADYIAFIDHDDIWISSKLEDQIKVFDKSNVYNLGLVYCDFEQIDVNNKVRKSNIIFDKKNRGGKLFNKNLNKNIIISSGSGVLIKKKCFNEVGLFDERLTAFEDWDMWLRIIRKYGIDYSEKILVQIRTHNRNMQKQYKHMLYNQFLFYRKWFLTTLIRKPIIIIIWSLRLLKNVFLYLGSNNMKTPKVSVVMPVYNGEKYIIETLNTLFYQDDYIKELIIVDDGSKDATASIIQKYKGENDKRDIIKLLSNKFQKGISGSLNTGLEIATGEYIARADGDDLYHSDRMKIQINFLDTHKKIDMVGSSFKTFGEEIKSKKIYRPIFSILTAFLGVRDTSLCHPTVMFRRKILQTIPNYPYVESEDYAFFSKILKKHRAVSLLKSLILYRRHENSYSINLNSEQPTIINTENIFSENYLYYIGDTKDSNVFSTFIKNRRLSRHDIGKILKISSKILSKIRTDYSLAIYSVDFIGSVIYVYFLIIYTYTKTQVKN